MLAWQLTVDQLAIFYQICAEVQADTEEQRVRVLTEMAKHGQIERVWATERTKTQFINDLAKNFKVARITAKENPDASAL